MNVWNPHNYLAHHGIKGQKWGQRRWQNDDGTWTEAGKIRRRVGKKDPHTRTDERPHTDYNLSKWGKSPDTNILWVTGLPGSGKSSIAYNIAKKNNADVINIDLYTFKTADKYVDQMSKSFNKFLDKNVPEWKNMQKEAYEVLTKNDRRKMKAAGKWFDTFEEALKDYGSYMYGKEKVIAEGVQILDETLFYNNKQGLKGQPVIIVNTSVEDSLIARMNRDNKSIEKLLEPERLRQLNTFIDGKQIIEEILNDDLQHSELMHYEVGTGYGPRQTSYASKYYDPVKAHEYYERTKQLKGRTRSASSLDDEGKQMWSYVKEQIAAEKQSKTESLKQELATSVAGIQAELAALRNLSGQERGRKKAEIQSRIKALRAQLASKKEQLQAELQSKQKEVTDQKSSKSREIQNENRAITEYIQATNKQASESVKIQNQQQSEAVKKQKEAKQAELTKVREKVNSGKKERQNKIDALQEQINNTTDKNEKAKLRSELKTLRADKKDYTNKSTEEISKLSENKKEFSAKASADLAAYKSANNAGLASFRAQNTSSGQAQRAANSESLRSFKADKQNEMNEFRAANKADVKAATERTTSEISKLRDSLTKYNEDSRAQTTEKTTELRSQIKALREANAANRKLLTEEYKNIQNDEFDKIAESHTKKKK